MVAWDDWPRPLLLICCYCLLARGGDHSRSQKVKNPNKKQTQTHDRKVKAWFSKCRRLWSRFVTILLPRILFGLILLHKYFFDFFSAENAIRYFVMVFHYFLKNAFVFHMFFVFCPIFAFVRNDFADFETHIER